MCLRYLLWDCFREDVITQDLEQLIIVDKQVVLQDYVVAKWSSHISFVKDLQGHIDPDDIKQFADAVERFTLFYSELDDEEPAAQDRIDCSILKGHTCHEDLALVWTHIRKHESKNIKLRNLISVKSLAKAVLRNRKYMEDLVMTTAKKKVFDKNANAMTGTYGVDIFKCSKINCYWFYAGFDSANTRDKHEKRHDRPYTCTIEGCTKQEVGFFTSQEQEQHRRKFHPEASDLSTIFTTMRATPTEAKFACPNLLCDKRFTRKAALDAHLFNHAGERPYACSICGKEFTRANDCRRHEKIHSKRA